jgi:hypothetical protein
MSRDALAIADYIDFKNEATAPARLLDRDDRVGSREAKLRCCRHKPTSQIKNFAAAVWTFACNPPLCSSVPLHSTGKGPSPFCYSSPRRQEQHSRAASIYLTAGRSPQPISTGHGHVPAAASLRRLLPISRRLGRLPDRQVWSFRLVARSALKAVDGWRSHALPAALRHNHAGRAPPIEHGGAERDRLANQARLIL